MDNVEFGKKLEKRTREFAVDIIKLSRSIPYSVESKVVRNQLTKSGTSVGANYREANRSRSKPDFINKIKICEGESNETVYWLEVINDLEWLDESELKSVYKEAKELSAMFTSIQKNLREKK